MESGMSVYPLEKGGFFKPPQDPAELADWELEIAAHPRGPQLRAEPERPTKRQIEARAELKRRKANNLK